jgi:hypothetical protein
MRWLALNIKNIHVPHSQLPQRNSQTSRVLGFYRDSMQLRKSCFVVESEATSLLSFLLLVFISLSPTSSSTHYSNDNTTFSIRKICSSQVFAEQSGRTCPIASVGGIELCFAT